MLLFKRDKEFITFLFFNEAFFIFYLLLRKCCVMASPYQIQSVVKNTNTSFYWMFNKT